jgi:hypothetical protein
MKKKKSKSKIKRSLKLKPKQKSKSKSMSIAKSIPNTKRHVLIPKPKIRKKKYIGSDCKYCSLEEGVYSMMYFCRMKDRNQDKDIRIICEDGFTGECKDYKKAKI